MLEWFGKYGVLEGDCDCISTFIGAGLAAMGVPARFVAIRTDEGNPEFTHVFTEGFDNLSWVRFDPTVPVDVVDGEVAYDSLVEYV